MLGLAEEVLAALHDGHPIVALESTIIAHGLPYPDNLELALELDAEVRMQGAVPATIAVLRGVGRVGLEERELTRIAEQGAAMGKATAADVAAYMTSGGDAATTVSATAVLAARAGIHLFATGGIGGVHRGVAGDVSCDLMTLANEQVAVVSSGAKAILDLPRTLEKLETLGVLVVGYRTGEFPAFYSRGSGLALEHQANEPAEVARLLHTRFEQLDLGGVLVANPVPEDAALPREEVERAILEGLERAAVSGVVGKRLTPFLLAHIAETVGHSAIVANRALARANAQLAAEVAVACAAV